MTDSKVYDFIGIGLGPFNIGLAALADQTPLNFLFFDKAGEFNWHPGMMIPGTHLQIPFMADLVTLADPTSPYSFLNYLKKQNRIYSFYIRQNFYILRKEYNQYCRWVLAQLPQCRFRSAVESIEKVDDVFYVSICHTETDAPSIYKTKRIVVGTGTTPAVPAFVPKAPDCVFHTSDYLTQKTNAQKSKCITVVGAGQSAAEVFVDLLREIDQHGYNLRWLTRSERFAPMEYTKLTLEMTSPEYLDHFYSLPQNQKDELNNSQLLLYKGINSDLINEIFDLLYQLKVEGCKAQIDIRPCTQLEDVQLQNEALNLTVKHTQTQDQWHMSTDTLILGTGYKASVPSFLEPLKDVIQWDEKGRYATNRNYSIDQHNQIFVQNAELHTHGFITPDLGMAAYKNSHILNTMLGTNYFQVEKQIAFQEFAPPAQPAAKSNPVYTSVEKVECLDNPQL